MHMDDGNLAGPQPAVEQTLHRFRGLSRMDDVIRLFKPGDEGVLLSLQVVRTKDG